MNKNNQEESIKNSWVKNPTKTQMILSSSAWATGVILIILSITNFFTENIFHKKFLILYFLVIASTYTVITVVANYFNNKKIKTADSISN